MWCAIGRVGAGITCASLWGGGGYAEGGVRYVVRYRSCGSRDYLCLPVRGGGGGYMWCAIGRVGAGITCASLKRYGVASSFLSSILSAMSWVISTCRLGGIGESMKQLVMADVFCCMRLLSECT